METNVAKPEDITVTSFNQNLKAFGMKGAGEVKTPQQQFTV